MGLAVRADFDAAGYVRSRATLVDLLAGRLDTYLRLCRWARAIRRLY